MFYDFLFVFFIMPRPIFARQKWPAGGEHPGKINRGAVLPVIPPGPKQGHRGPIGPSAHGRTGPLAHGSM